MFHLFLFEYSGKGISQKKMFQVIFYPKIKKKSHLVDAYFRIINIFCIVAFFFYNETLFVLLYCRKKNAFHYCIMTKINVHIQIYTTHIKYFNIMAVFVLLLLCLFKNYWITVFYYSKKKKKNICVFIKMSQCNN